MNNKEFTFSSEDNGARDENQPAATPDAAQRPTAQDNTKTLSQTSSLAASPATPCVAACPLAQVPAPVWKALLQPPFRKRHPLLFWGGLALLAVLCLIAYVGWDEDGQGLFGGGERLALVTVRGPILDVGPTLDWIRKIERNPRIKGVLLRVDSPGGGAAASQEVYDALANLARTRPVAVSMGSMAASGGLMISMAGQRIFANPSTVTGSIGVRMDIPQLQGLMDKIGVGQETLVTAPYKDAGSYLRPLTPEQRAYFKNVLDHMHAQFVDIVAQGRNMPREEAARLASGKIFTGQEAQKLGLVDALGGQDAAHRWLAQQTNVPMERTLLRQPRTSSWLSRSLKSWLGLDVSALAALAGLHGADGDWRTPVFLYQF